MTAEDVAEGRVRTALRMRLRTPEDVADAVAELSALGLAVQSRRRVIQMNPYVHVPVLAWLARRELA